MPEYENVCRWIDATRAHQRGAIAIDAADGTLTYQQLFDRADQLSDLLRASGVGPGSLVTLCYPRSAAYIVSALAIMRCGAAYVPLDPESPIERLQFIIDDCGAQLLVADGPSASRLGAVPVRIITIDLSQDADGGGQWLSSSGEPQTDRPREDQVLPGLAYVVYTSGSTGKPKGVMVEHPSLLNLASWHINAFDVSPSDRVSQVSGPAFDAAVWEIWPSLAAGACLVIPDDITRRDPGALLRFLVHERINVAFVPTAIAERLINLTWPADTSLRYLLTGGDALHAVPPAGLPFALVNNYGLTEAAVVSTSGVVQPDDDGSPPIGRAIHGAELSVVDALLRPVEDGVAGELVVSGPSVARGYVNRPELDHGRFIPDESRPGMRRLRTGDLVRRQQDGRIEFLGRLDDQVKVRGYRIEPGEVAAALDRHPSIASSHVVLGGDSPRNHCLNAYIVAAAPVAAADAGSTPEPAELVAFLRRTLPEYMVPRSFTWVDDLTLSVNGKIDGAALARGVSLLPAEPSEEPWQTELAGAVSSLVGKLLGIHSVALDDDFFLLGGHSLLGAQLVGRVSEQFGVELRLRDVFDHPTVAGLAARIGELVMEDIDRLDDDEAIALASGQV